MGGIYFVLWPSGKGQLMDEQEVKPGEETPTVRGLFWTAADTNYIMNCHICASRDVELVHVHYHRPELIQHECPMCANRLGPTGPYAECEVCKEEFGA